MNLVKLGEVCKIKNGYAFKSTEFQSHGTPLLKISSFNDGEVYINSKTVFVNPEYLNSKSEFIVEKGDILIALSGATTGKFGFYNFDYPSLLNQRIGLLKSGLSKKLNSKYFYFYLSILKIEILRNAGGAAQPNISTKTISDLKIPLPPLPEQKKIAAILDEADRLRQLNQQVLEKYDALTQSLFLEMFGDPVTNPKGWEKNRSEDYVDVLTGYAFKSVDYSKNKEEVKLCGGLIIMPWGINWNKANYWKSSMTDGLEKYWLSKDDIVIAMDRPWISSGFKIAMIQSKDIPSLLVQRTARIRGKGINQIFLYYQYNSIGFKRHAKPTETTVPHISPKDIKSFELIIPPFELQNQFADRIRTIETQKSQAQAALKSSEDLFNSLLQKAFKGELIKEAV